MVGGTIMIWHALAERGITAESFDYPEDLIGFRGRRIWKTALKDLGKENLPFFIKPVEEKIAPGIVINTLADLEDDYGMLDDNTKVYCSEPVKFESEWRCFPIYQNVVGIEFYSGNKKKVYDKKVIDAAVKAYPDMPAGYALDFGVTDDGRTLLIEMNDGYSLGAYGLDPVSYAKLLTARWAELNKTGDPFRHKI